MNKTKKITVKVKMPKLSEKLIKLSSNLLNDYVYKGHRNCPEPKNLNGSFKFIGLDSEHVIRLMMVLVSYLKTQGNIYTKKFLDAGCGIGNILLIAKSLQLNVYGLEIHKPYIYYLKKESCVYDSSRKNIIETDILKYRGYGKYDIIYFYCPFQDARKEKRFELNVAKQMKVGAYLLPIMPGGTYYSPHLEDIFYTNFEKIILKSGVHKLEIYKKIKENHV